VNGNAAIKHPNANRARRRRAGRWFFESLYSILVAMGSQFSFKAPFLKPLFALAFWAPFAVVHPVAADTSTATVKNVRSIDDVLRNAKRRDLVLVAGTVKRSFDLDNILLSDDSGEIAVSLVGLRQDLRPGDRVAVAGRFDGRVSFRSNYGLLTAIDWAPQSGARFDQLKNKYGVATSTTSASVAPTPAAASDVEPRLRQLDDLKSKNLVTPDEYQEQRKRILNDL
jgi:hypothetical protein